MSRKYSTKRLPYLVGPIDFEEWLAWIHELRGEPDPEPEAKKSAAKKRKKKVTEARV